MCSSLLQPTTDQDGVNGMLNSDVVLSETSADEESGGRQDPEGNADGGYVDHTLSFVENVPEPAHAGDTDGCRTPPRRTAAQGVSSSGSDSAGMELDTMGNAVGTIASAPLSGTQKGDHEAKLSGPWTVGLLSVTFHALVLLQVVIYVALLVVLCVGWDGSWADGWFTPISFNGHVSQFVTGTPL